MGILRCDVKDCENIMCDRYSHKYGYICNDCFDQLVKLGTKTSLKGFFEGRIELPEDELASLNYFNTLFPSRGD